MIDKDVGAKITDQEVRARYDKQMADTTGQRSQGASYPGQEHEEEADAIIKQLDGGAKFEDLAAQHTTDPSGKTTGGDLGYFAPGQMVPEFETAAFALDVGGYTKTPVQSQFGWHVIKIEDKRAQQPPAYDTVKDEIRNLVFREKYFAMVNDLRKTAKVDVTDPDLKKTVDAMDQAQTPQRRTCRLPAGVDATRGLARGLAETPARAVPEGSPPFNCDDVTKRDRWPAIAG